MSAEDKFEKGVVDFVTYVLKKARRHEAKTKNRKKALAGLDEAIVDLAKDRAKIDAKAAKKAAKKARAAADAAAAEAVAAQARADAAAATADAAAAAKATSVGATDSD